MQRIEGEPENTKKGNRVKGSFLQEEQIKIVKWLKKVISVSTILVWLLSGPTQAAGDSNASDSDVIGQVEHVLTQVAKEGPHWHARKHSIQREVHDVTFLLERSWRAAEQSKHTERRDYAQQALIVLQRGAKLGHFDLTKTEPVLTLIRQLLSNQAG
jgi:hypothetical protein